MLDPVDIDIYENDELKHWGILGMHWGIRRYQNPDGTLTPEGRERYGVGDAAKTKMLTYSKEYEVLKHKKNKTEEENKKLEELEIGKALLNRKIADPDKFKKDFAKLPKNMQQQFNEYLNSYVGSTNYGKSMTFCSAMMGLPLGIIGVAADAGAVYLQAQAGMPIQLIPGLGVFSAYIGMGIGAGLYESKHEEEFTKEHTNENGKQSYKNLDKTINQYLKEDIDWVKKNYEGAVAYDPMNNMVARAKGANYSDTDKKYTEWEKQHIRDYAKKNLKV